MIVGDVGSRVIGLLFSVILARLLLPEHFGLIVTSQIITGTLGYVSGGGMSDALIRSPGVTDRDRNTVFTTQLAICLLIIALLNGIAPSFATLFQEPCLEPVLRVAALTFLLRPLMHVALAILQREMRFREASILLFVTISTSGLASTVMAFLGMGVWSLLLGGLTGSLVRIAILLRMTRWVPRLTFDLDAARRLGSFGIRVSIIDFLQFARVQSTNAFVSRGIGIASVGLYNKADSLAEMPYDILSTSAFQTMFRALSVTQGDLTQSAYLFIRSITLVSFYALPCYVGLAWVSESLVLTLFGDNWREVAVPLQILSLAGLPRIITNLSGAVTAAQDRLAQEIPIQFQTLALSIAGVVVGVHWGVEGAALGVLPSFLYSAIRMYGLAGSALGIGWRSLASALGPVIWMNGLMAAALALGQFLLLGLDIPRDSTTFLVVMVLIGTATYAGHFLVAPPQALRGESGRWRHQLGATLGRFRP